MSRFPKWLLLKEWLSYQDVVKLLENAPSTLEYALSQDLSEEIRNIFKFVCTFCPESCKKEFKEYRLEEIARQKMRTHLKDHINSLKTSVSKDDNKDFRARNQLFKGPKCATQKHKSAMPLDKVVPRKKSKIIKNFDLPDVKSKVKLPKVKNQRYTKLRESSSEKIPEERGVILQLKNENSAFQSEMADIHEEIEVQKTIEEFCAASSIHDEYSSECKADTDISEDNDSSDKRNFETQTLHGGKEQETFQYKVATKLFSADRSLWNSIDQVLDEIVRAEEPSEKLLQPDKEKILIGMRQWIDSVQIYERQTVSRVKDPLTQAEKNILDSLTNEDWKKLEASQDSESKLRLTVYARLLLRDYECIPKKLKPKDCRHCGKHYTASTSLYSHLVSLSGIRFWVCSKCKDSNMEEATFTRKHSLQYHILKEVGIPRYRCTQPGCSKTHNHTHHQKSHARQHTGEKHYICVIETCKGRFSNRNTYSRHLLQFHNVELTRSNQLREIDEKEAKLKVFAARLKARERSKCKRQKRSNSKKASDLPTPVKSEGLQRKVTIDENILTAAQHFLKEVKLEEDIKKECYETNNELSLEKFMKPSGSKLLYGIARDVRNTTTSMEEAKSENMMGGLNLLATVSKYMNAESCLKGSDSSDNKVKEHHDCHNMKAFDKVSCSSQVEEVNLNSNNEPSNSDESSNFSSGQLTTVCFDKEMDYTDNNEANSSKATHIFSVAATHTASTTPQQVIEEKFQNNFHENVKIPDNSSSSNMKYLTIANIKVLPTPAMAVNKSIAPTPKLMHVIQPPFSQSRGKTQCSLSETSQKINMKTTPNQFLLPLADNNILDSPKNVNSVFIPCSSMPFNCLKHDTLSDVKSESPPSTLSNQKNVENHKIVAQSLLQSTQVIQAESNKLLHLNPNFENTCPLSGSLLSDISASNKCDVSLPGRIVSEPNMSTSVNTNHIQVIKVTNSQTPLQFRSMTTLSGKTYIVLSSSGSQNKALKSINSVSSVGDNETTPSTRILPFSEL